jgi:hypothetical protein
MGRPAQVHAPRDGTGALVGMLLAALLTWGCASGPAVVTSPPAATAPVPSPTRAVSPTLQVTASPFPSDDAFARMVATVSGGPHPEGSQLELLWRGIISGAHVDGQRPYQPPARVVGYRTGDIPDVACADGTDARFWRQNAYYCRTDRAIAFDETWLRDLYGRLGPAAVKAILAHEWGHSVQDMIGSQDYSIRNELQADCFAGMFIASTELSGLDPDQRRALEIALVAFFEIGNRDYDGSAWFQAAEHGSPQQRILAYTTGADPLFDGLPWCYGYRDFTPRDVATVGPYRFLNLPGRTERVDGGVYTIDPEARTGYGSSGIRISWIDALPIGGQGAIVEQLHELARVRLPGWTLLADPQVIDANVPRGSGVFQYFERAAQGGSPAESGVLALVSPASKHGGLQIVIHREQAAPIGTIDAADIAVLQEEIVAVFQVLARLCGPDDSSTVGDPNLDPVCMDVQ